MIIIKILMFLANATIVGLMSNDLIKAKPNDKATKKVCIIGIIFFTMNCLIIIYGGE